ncbi:tRNA (guanosine(37)-N1)-methyltransferase TrmD [bacterium Unc6]|nr:tRNA (guanosine(37)-N1)-methyltransferase TrmD [bacterium Unc6]
MKIDILTLFPEMFDCIVKTSMWKIAIKRSAVDIQVHNIRDWTYNKHKKADDRPYGGGAGMVLSPEPIFEAVEQLRSKSPYPKDVHIILTIPRGVLFTQAQAQHISTYKHIIVLCGHYEGIDERVSEVLVTDEISIGDYILTSGEIAGMVIIDAVLRLVPGVLGDPNSKYEESFLTGTLEYPHYTRPSQYRGLNVPDVLLSGNHKAIKKWRKEQAEKITREKRPDLLKKDRP